MTEEKNPEQMLVKAVKEVLETAANSGISLGNTQFKQQGLEMLSRGLSDKIVSSTGIRPYGVDNPMTIPAYRTKVNRIFSDIIQMPKRERKEYEENHQVITYSRTSLLGSIAKFVNRGKCQNLIKYQGRTFEFKGLTAEISGATVSLGEFSTKIKNIDSIAETARALDQFQFHLCKSLSNPVLRDNLTKEDLLTYTRALIGAQACILQFRIALEAYKQDPKGQRDNLDASIRILQSFVQSVTPELNTEEQRKVVSDAFSSVGIDEKEADMVISNLIT